MVQILRGRDRGKKAKVMAVLPAESRLIVEGLHQVKKHVKPRRSNEKGQRISISAPLPAANVQLVCASCGKITRIGVRRLPDGVRERFCKKCQAGIA